MSVEAWVIVIAWIFIFGSVICWAVEQNQKSPKPSKKPVTAQEPAYVPRHNAKTRTEERSIEQAWVRQFSELQIQRHKASAEWKRNCSCDREEESAIADASYRTIITRRDPECRVHKLKI
jgi:hypothetical protein